MGEEQENLEPNLELNAKHKAIIDKIDGIVGKDIAHLLDELIDIAVLEYHEYTMKPKILTMETKEALNQKWLNKLIDKLPDDECVYRDKDGKVVPKANYGNTENRESKPIYEHTELEPEELKKVNGMGADLLKAIEQSVPKELALLFIRYIDLSTDEMLLQTYKNSNELTDSLFQYLKGQLQRNTQFKQIFLNIANKNVPGVKTKL